MASSNQEIMAFAVLVRRLIDNYKSMQDELTELKQQLSKQQQDAKDMETLANASMHDYDMLKTARMLEVGDGDIDTARNRVNKLLRDVNRCITLLSEQQNTSPKDLQGKK